MTFIRDPAAPPQTKRPSGKKPIEDAVLGRISWNDNFDWWEAQVELRAGETVDLSIYPRAEQDDCAATGRAFMSWLDQQESAIRQFAAEQLLELHNDSWNQGEPISLQTFASRLTLESVSIDSDGGAEIYYEDGDLFWGHCITVSVDKDRNFEDADIAG